jgi:hypothetical protein
VDEYFYKSDNDRALVCSGMRSIAEDIAMMLEHLRAVAEDRPPPTATLMQIRARTACGSRVDFRFADGIIYRYEIARVGMCVVSSCAI